MGDLSIDGTLDQARVSLALEWRDGRPRGIRVSVGDPDAGRFGFYGHRFPLLGEHSREILVELGFDDAEVAEMRRTGAVP